MLQKDNKQRILQLFFDKPTTPFQLRQVSRLARLAPPSTKKYLKELETEGFVKKITGTIYPAYRARRDNPRFKNAKKWSLALQLATDGLIDHITERCAPDAIILFGSASRGEDIESSDIDLAILAKETPVDFKKYERILNRPISPHFFPNFKSISNELKNNIINGIILSGYLKVF